MVDEKQPLVSVIVPVFNTPADHLRACIGSILSQDYRFIEVIVIDDGSESICRENCDELTKIDSRIRVFHQDNTGVSNARNHGIDVAAGEYCIFVDSDDLLIPSYLTDSVIFASNNALDLVFGCHKRRYKNRDIDESERSIELENFRILNSEEQYLSLIWLLSAYIPKKAPFLSGLAMGACAKLYRRDAIGKIRFPADVAVYEDTLFTADVVRNCKRVGIVYRPWYIYNQNEFSAYHGAKAFSSLEQLYNELSLYEAFTGDENCKRLTILSNLIRFSNNTMSRPWSAGAAGFRAEMQKDYAIESVKLADFSNYSLSRLNYLRITLFRHRLYSLLAIMQKLYNFFPI